MARNSKGIKACYAYMGRDTRVDWPTAELAALFAAGIIKRRFRVLDLGCGNGTEALFLASLGCQVVAVDNDMDSERIHIVLQKRFERAGARIEQHVEVVRGIHADASYYWERHPGTFDAVIDRLCLHNMNGDLQRQCIVTAAYALRYRGVFIVRMLQCREDSIAKRGKMNPKDSAITSSTRNILKRFFNLSDEVRFAGLATPREDKTTDSLTKSAIPMTIMVATRNSISITDKLMRRRVEATRGRPRLPKT